MSIRYTAEQVNAQQVRFDSFMSSVNLVKLGERYVHFLNSNEGLYNEYNYLMSVLNRVADVKGAMYHPDLNRFYIDILKVEALEAFIASLK